MSLQNLAKIGLLVEHDTDKRQVGKLMEAAERFVEDARQETISLETRLDAAYKAAMQLATLALWANGYRPATNMPGHHQTTIQSLVHTIDLDNDHMLLLDTFRVKRNAIDYTGEVVDPGSVITCIEATVYLQGCLQNWLSEKRPDLLDQ